MGIGEMAGYENRQTMWAGWEEWILSAYEKSFEQNTQDEIGDEQKPIETEEGWEIEGRNGAKS
jgi:hypothetical protein